MAAIHEQQRVGRTPSEAIVQLGQGRFQIFLRLALLFQREKSPGAANEPGALHARAFQLGLDFHQRLLGLAAVDERVDPFAFEQAAARFFESVFESLDALLLLAELLLELAAREIPLAVVGVLVDGLVGVVERLLVILARAQNIAAHHQERGALGSFGGVFDAARRGVVSLVGFAGGEVGAAEFALNDRGMGFKGQGAFEVFDRLGGLAHDVVFDGALEEQVGGFTLGLEALGEFVDLVLRPFVRAGRAGQRKREARQENDE